MVRAERNRQRPYASKDVLSVTDAGVNYDETCSATTSKFRLTVHPPTVTRTRFTEPPSRICRISLRHVDNRGYFPICQFGRRVCVCVLSRVDPIVEQIRTEHKTNCGVTTFKKKTIARIVSYTVFIPTLSAPEKIPNDYSSFDSVLRFS